VVAAADRWLDILEIRPLADRYPDELSGGQRQRTRWRAPWPPSRARCFLDEPFAALDASLRVRLRDELRELQSRLGVPDPSHHPRLKADVAAFADDVVRIDDGRAVAEQPPFDPEIDP
jgi:molybdate transport system ATP-binding protein